MSGGYTDYGGEDSLQEREMRAERIQNHDRSQPLSKPRRGNLDIPFLTLTLLILLIGVLTVFSASFARAYYSSGNPARYFLRQCAFAGSGILIMLVVSKVSVDLIRRISFPLMAVSIIMLALVPIIGVEENGATRWISLGFTTFQPSEIVKLAEILLFSDMICRYKEKMKTVKYGVLPFAVTVVIIVGLLFLEPHLSASVIIIAVAGIMMFAGGTQTKWFAIAGVVIVVVAVLTVTKFSYASDRITAWLHPEDDPSDKGYQILQSLYSVGSGGLLGLGFGQSRQKYMYLPEEHNDYIFAVWCEEMGFIGALLVLLLFVLLITRGFWLAVHARTRFGSLVVTGLSSLLAIQVFLNVAVVTNLIPSTGISLPFFSYGGTALWIQLVEMGVILSISRDIPIKKAG